MSGATTERSAERPVAPPVRRLADLSPAAVDRLCRRGRMGDPGVERVVAGIVADVRDRGDGALRELAARFDRVPPDAYRIEVPRSTWDAAVSSVEPAVLDALAEAAAAIRRFHAAQMPAPLEMEPRPGLRLGRRPDPLRRVGVYAPGGRAAYPSSVLMGVVPARVAGVDEVVVCSPPGPDGAPAPLVVAACAVAGADRLLAIGGAGAVAALAYGTATVPAVDRVVGPGNAYVAEAKRQLSAVVGIDSPAGPSELLVVADSTADPGTIVREMLAQAEHDPDAAVVLVTTDPDLARRVMDRLGPEAAEQPRADIIRQALAGAGAALVAEDLPDALAFAERYAPEHLLLLVADPRAALRDVRCAGTVFLGPRSSVAFGDYATGANHTLPTGGLARSYSGLSVDDFLRWTTWQEADAAAAAGLARTAAVLADAEGLPAHAAAARWAGGGAAGAIERVAPSDRTPEPRPEYRSLDRYDPARRPIDLDLSANTSLRGPAPATTAVLARGDEVAARAVAYPTPYADALKAAAADLWGVDASNVVTGCGSDDLIDSAIRAYGGAGATVAFPAPTFPMAGIFARMNGARPVPVMSGPPGELEAAALARLLSADVVYLCRPNNPTGALMPRAAVREVLDRARGLVLVDEAYGEYAGETVLADVLASGRGLVLRTLSKACGLAGLRVGYAMGPPEIVEAVELSRGPYKVGTVAESAAVAALGEQAWLAEAVAETVASRDRLAGELSARGMAPLPSAGNFLLVPHAGAARLKSGLAARGVGVRAFEAAALPGIGAAIRVTAGPWPAMERFLEALDGALAEVSR